MGLKENVKLPIFASIIIGITIIGLSTIRYVIDQISLSATSTPLEAPSYRRNIEAFPSNMPNDMAGPGAFDDSVGGPGAPPPHFPNMPQKPPYELLRPGEHDLHNRHKNSSKKEDPRMDARMPPPRNAVPPELQHQYFPPPDPDYRPAPGSKAPPADGQKNDRDLLEQEMRRRQNMMYEPPSPYPSQGQMPFPPSGQMPYPPPGYPFPPSNRDDYNWRGNDNYDYPPSIYDYYGEDDLEGRQNKTKPGFDSRASELMDYLIDYVEREEEEVEDPLMRTE